MTGDDAHLGIARSLVAIGASAGGPPALAALLHGLPATFPAGIVIVQHVDAQFALGMAAWLGEQTALPVRVAVNGDRVVAGTILLAASNEHLVFTSPDRLEYAREPQQTLYRPSIDAFFHSVIRHWRGDAVGVLLTGMGRDGAAGLRSMRDRGLYTIAQDEESSAVYGMPKAAIALDAAVDVLPIERVASQLIHALATRPADTASTRKRTSVTRMRMGAHEHTANSFHVKSRLPPTMRISRRTSVFLSSNLLFVTDPSDRATFS